MFNLNPTLTVSTMIFSYSLLSGYGLLLGLKYGGKKIYSIKKAAALIAAYLALIWLALWINSIGADSEKIELAKTVSIILGLIAGFLSTYVLSKN